jgi:formate dehydrogenase major subunit
LPYCAVGCGQNVFVKDSGVVQIEGDPDSPMSRGRPFGTEWEQLGLDTAMDMIADRVPGARRHGWQREVDRNRTRRTLGFAGWAARS